MNDPIPSTAGHGSLRGTSGFGKALREWFVKHPNAEMEARKRRDSEARNKAIEAAKARRLD